MFGRFSLGKLGLFVGGALTLVGFFAYFTERATLNLVGFFYGIPLLLGGLALSAAELQPVPFSQPTTSDVLALREQQATETQNQIRKDVTRYRYGQNAHLDSSLDALQLGVMDDEQPILQGIREEAIAGSYALVLEFDSEYVSLESWQAKRDKLERFFGPGIRAEVAEPAPHQIEIKLISSPVA
ncbi:MULTISPECIES: DUF2854 domain-containing protein [unclassified Leptolyngbya]|uniref:DUF2854 domain-containing protein n=1 Tax=unclassified Leptolyngbya TaxID=2650499 RepID=UPI001681F72B|nr:MULTISPECIES: DUF2854 domain-containing protein [unclassified Leptolyngbya]MBD1912163.1 DUF2854 domain-containing protein [Leptolyngbya sp. FACHB-8]MBD2155054.1 DUF2854 domain-containing protein [Leptolyngbya sp. FACHB-16]